MRRLLYLTIAIAVIALLGGSTAMLNGQNGKMLPEQGSGEQSAPVVDSMPQTYLGSGRYHKMIIGKEDEATYALLQSRGAIVQEINYGSFKLIGIDENVLGGRDNLKMLTV